MPPPDGVFGAGADGVAEALATRRPRWVETSIAGSDAFRSWWVESTDPRHPTLSLPVDCGTHETVILVATVARDRSARTTLLAAGTTYSLHVGLTHEFVRAVEERRRAERALEQLAERLRDARDAAVAHSLAKSAFLANMSHELRTPLNAIIGYAELLGEDAEDNEAPEMREDLQRIETAGRHLLSLINNILDLSKIEAGRMEVHVAPFEVGDLIEEIAATAEPLAARNGSVLLAGANVQSARWRGDVVKIRQMLLNLLSNACKYTDNGTVSVRIEERPDAAMPFVALVADTGIGMSEEQKRKLFAEFWQADTNANRNQAGTGLGMAITRSFTKIMGGEIYVDSAPGKGTRIEIHLPLEPIEEPAPAPRAVCMA